MGLFDFFKRKQIANGSIEQISFAEKAVEIITPAIDQFGFGHNKTEVEKYSTKIVWRKDKRYIRVCSSNYPTDYPYYYNIVLGEGNSNDFSEYDWNSIALWRLKQTIDPTAKTKEYSFPLDDKIIYSLTNAKNELLKFGHSFLSNDLRIFYETRTSINSEREAYKINKRDKNGIYQTTYEEESLKQKKKFT